MNKNDESRLRKLESLGQSLWLDYIDRALLTSGEMERLIRDDGISGVTSNPAIFEKAISRNAEYDQSIAELARRGLDSREIYEELTVADVTMAADLLRNVYHGSKRRNGYVSLEVSPHLAYDAAATVIEAKRLWDIVNRPNLMIKVPATRPGLTAIRKLIAMGINTNATLLFNVARYREVSESYLAGLEDRLANGGILENVASVASFFLSRIDTLVDRALDNEKKIQTQGIRGKTAIACARLAYQEYLSVVNSTRWLSLAGHGAQTQRLLWASTSTKDPAYSNVIYVESLIGADTVNTLPPETMAAYREHGNPMLRLNEDMNLARALPSELAVLGLDLDKVGDELEKQGVQKFIEPYELLLATLTQRSKDLAG